MYNVEEFESSLYLQILIFSLRIEFLLYFKPPIRWLNLNSYSELLRRAWKKACSRNTCISLFLQAVTNVHYKKPFLCRTHRSFARCCRYSFYGAAKKNFFAPKILLTLTQRHWSLKALLVLSLHWVLRLPLLMMWRCFCSFWYVFRSNERVATSLRSLKSVF